MAMAIIIKREGKKGVSYLIRAYDGYDVNGRQIISNMTWKPEPGMTEKQIEKAVNKAAILFEDSVQNGAFIDSNIRFAEFSEKWMQDYASGQLAPKTIERYKSLLARINQCIGHIHLNKLQPHHLNELYKNLSEGGMRLEQRAVAKPELLRIIKTQKITNDYIVDKAKLAYNTITRARQNKKIALASAKAIAMALDTDIKKIFDICSDSEPLSGLTILHHHRLIGTILQTAVDWQVIHDNPSRRVKSPKVVLKEANYLEDTEAAQIVTALSHEPIKWKTMVILLLASGMRRGEVDGLEWQDIDFKNNLIHIRRVSQYVIGMGIIEKSTKNVSSERVLKLPPDVFTLLRSYRVWQAEEKLKQGDRWQNKIPIKYADGKIETRVNNRLFTQETGLPIHPDSITKWVAKFRKRHSLPDFSPHTLRHTNVSLMIAAGVPMRNISQRAGHAQLSTTQNIYAHAIKTADEKAAQAIGAVIVIK